MFINAKKNMGSMVKNNYHDSRFVFDERRDFIWRSISSYLQKYVPIKSRILDLGAGYCNFINNIDAEDKFALDLFPGIKKYAAGDVKTIISSCTDMSCLKSGSFDVVFTSNLFEHLTREELDKTIRNVGRILRKNGRLIIIQPNFKYAYKEYFDDYTHREIFTEISLKDYLETNGFNIMKVIPRFIPFSMKSKMSLMYFLLPIYIRSPIRPMAKQMLIIANKR